MKLLRILVGIGMAALLTGIGSSGCQASCALSDEAMGAIHGGCDLYYCTEGVRCDAPPCDPLDPYTCPDSGGNARCSSTNISNKCMKSYWGWGDRYCDAPQGPICGFGMIHSICTLGVDLKWTCQGGQKTGDACDGFICRAWSD